MVVEREGGARAFPGDKKEKKQC
uniref:Uncharacterized protein n=1 Tax=Anguilla anguilla TaxID=7936 RepID=A0A0E9QJZ7_ANGAN